MRRPSSPDLTRLRELESRLASGLVGLIAEARMVASEPAATRFVATLALDAYARQAGPVAAMSLSASRAATTDLRTDRFRDAEQKIGWQPE